jgi:hypothetical protein
MLSARDRRCHVFLELYEYEALRVRQESTDPAVSPAGFVWVLLTPHPKLLKEIAARCFVASQHGIEKRGDCICKLDIY